jgi:predicted nucleotidyltransferase
VTQEDILVFLNAHKSEFREKFGIAKLAFFGSFAKNEATQDSDIDILVSYVNNQCDVFTHKQNFRQMLQNYFQRPVDIANEKYLKPYAKDEILHDAIYI